MNSNITQAIKEAYSSAPTDEIIFDTLEFRHDSFKDEYNQPFALRFIRDFSDRTLTLENDAPLNGGEAVEFIACAFDVVLPPEEDAPTPELTLTLDNIGRPLTEHIDQAVIYGNTASAMGKDLSQFIEAVADATTSEFERLKEFGIKAKQQGDRVSFTFRGMTTTIGNNAEEIEQFLIRLGENEFDGAMTERMDTLNGAASNLSDSWDKLFRSIGDGAIGDLMKDSMILAAEAIGAVSEKIVILNDLYDSTITKVAAFIELSGKEREEYLENDKLRRLGLNTK